MDVCRIRKNKGFGLNISSLFSFVESFALHIELTSYKVEIVEIERIGILAITPNVPVVFRDVSEMFGDLHMFH